MNALALIVPTRNRLDFAINLLRSLENQFAEPHQLIIVDGSDAPIEDDLRAQSNMPFTYEYVSPPGLTKQRNVGIRAVKEHITLVGYLDDDIIVEDGAIKTLVDFWATCAEDVGGTSFHIINNPRPRGGWLYRFFGISHQEQGKILPSGFCTPVWATEPAVPAEWLCGGATVWRRTILDEMKYDEWFQGAAYYEDAEFSFRVSKTHKLLILRDAKIQHLPPPPSPDKAEHLGVMDVTFRYYFVYRSRGAVSFSFWWATLGHLLINLFAGFCLWKPFFRKRAIGQLRGIKQVLLGQVLEPQ